MTDARTAWNEIGDKLTELGRKLKIHYESQHGSEGQQTREELASAARCLGSAVQDAFETLGAAARDKAVQDDVKQVGQSLAEALGVTLGQAAEELRRALSERKGPMARCCGTHPTCETTTSEATTSEAAGDSEPSEAADSEAADSKAADSKAADSKAADSEAADSKTVDSKTVDSETATGHGEEPPAKVEP